MTGSQPGAAGTWFVGLGFGMTGGGDLWRIETANGAVIPWQSSVPFSSSRFSATLGNNFGAGLFVGHRLGDRWSVRLDLSSARMDVTAEALQGQQAGVFGYDRLTLVAVGLSAEFKLVRLPSAPYATLGLVAHDLSAAREDQLNQTRLGFRVGLGYLRELDARLGLRVEARYSRSGFETGDFLPQSRLTTQPPVAFAPHRDLNIFELIFAVQMYL